MTLQTLLGNWLYWPLVVMTVGFAIVSTFSNVSLVYTEIWHQIKELKRLRNK